MVPLFAAGQEAPGGDPHSRLFFADATWSLWRRGDRGRALGTGGSLILFLLVVHLLVLGLDRNRRINYVNPFVCDETGYSSEELLGRGFGELSQRERACTSPIWCTF